MKYIGKVDSLILSKYHVITFSRNINYAATTSQNTAKKTLASNSSTCQDAGFGESKDDQLRAQEHSEHPFPHKRSKSARRLNPCKPRADAKGNNSKVQGVRHSLLRCAHPARG